MIKNLNFEFKFITSGFFILIVFLSGCNMGEIEKDKPFDWKLSEHRKLFDTTESVTWNHIIDFTFIDDSTYFLYGRNYVTGFYRTYLIKSDSVVNLTANFNGFVDEICVSGDNVFYLQNDASASDMFFYNSKIYLSNLMGNDLQELPMNEINYFKVLHFMNQDTGIALNNYNLGINNEFRLTFDHGESWQSALIDSSLKEISYYRSFFTVPNNPKICFLSNGKKLYISENGGINWNLYINLDFDISTVYFVDKYYGYIVSNNKIYKTLNGGNIVELIFEFKKQIEKIQVISNDIYILAERFLYYSNNDFVDYRKMELENPHPENFDRFIINFEIRKDIGYVVDNLGNIFYRIE